MRPTLLLYPIALATLVSCGEPCSLAGNWGWVSNGNPSGSSLNMQLYFTRFGVSGTAVAGPIGPVPIPRVPDTATVVGVYQQGSPDFVLTFHYRSGLVVSYTGSLACPSMLQGTATAGGQPYALAFNRQ
jgi:hypothetical protein